MFEILVAGVLFPCHSTRNKSWLFNRINFLILDMLQTGKTALLLFDLCLIVILCHMLSITIDSFSQVWKKIEFHIFIQL